MQKGNGRAENRYGCDRDYFSIFPFLAFLLWLLCCTLSPNVNFVISPVSEETVVSASAFASPSDLDSLAQRLRAGKALLASSSVSDHRLVDLPTVHLPRTQPRALLSPNPFRAQG